MARVHPIVFLVDVDNTLLDNDGVQQDLKDHSAFAPSIHSKWSFCRCLRT
jgi:hypothetical protein